MAALTMHHVPGGQVRAPVARRRMERATDSFQLSPTTTQDLGAKFSISHGTEPKTSWTMISLTW